MGSQYTLKMQWAWLATTLGGFKEGTCWEHGYNVNEGSKEISMPLIGKTDVRLFKAPENENLSMEVFTQSSPDIISALLLALLSLAGISATIFAMLHLRRGTFVADEEALLASWNL